MSSKAKPNVKNLKVTPSSDNQPKVVRSYRIDPVKWEAAEQKCKEQYGRGLSSFLGDLAIAYFKV